MLRIESRTLYLLGKFSATEPYICMLNWFSVYIRIAEVEVFEDPHPIVHCKYQKN